MSYPRESTIWRPWRVQLDRANVVKVSFADYFQWSFMAAGSRHSSDWMLVPSVIHCGLKLDNQAARGFFRTLVRILLCRGRHGSRGYAPNPQPPCTTSVYHRSAIVEHKSMPATSNSELRFHASLDTKWTISATFFLANLLAQYWTKLNLTQQTANNQRA